MEIKTYGKKNKWMRFIIKLKSLFEVKRGAYVSISNIIKEDDWHDE